MYIYIGFGGTAVRPQPDMARVLSIRFNIGDVSPPFRWGLRATVDFITKQKTKRPSVKVNLTILSGAKPLFFNAVSISLGVRVVRVLTTLHYFNKNQVHQAQTNIKHTKRSKQGDEPDWMA